MIEETRVHVAVVAVFAIIVGVVLVFWLTPSLIVYGFFLMVVVLAYGALYLVIASWLDPQKDEVKAASEDGSTEDAVASSATDLPDSGPEDGSDASSDTNDPNEPADNDDETDGQPRSSS